MSATVSLEIHPSAFPEAVSRSLAASLRAKALAPRFLYEGLRQTQKWLRLHEQFSPARTDAEVRNIYAKAFEEIVSTRPVSAHTVEVISVGCGSAAKDCVLLGQLVRAGKQVFYTPMDVSVGMVVTAREAALKWIPPERCRPVVCDLVETADFLQSAPRREPSDCERRITIVLAFGLMPSFEPEVLLPVLAQAAASAEVLLVSANLAPGSDYAAGVQHVFAGYDNELTRDWLWSALNELDLWPADGKLNFDIEERPDASGLRRIVACLKFLRARTVRVDEEQIRFDEGDSLQVFFSYRHTPELLHALLRGHRMTMAAKWLVPEEGVFRVAHPSLRDS